MRVIGGIYRSRRIEFPKHAYTRPTKDRVREAVFNILAKKITGSRILDLYAGSGAFGIEALSRGAEKAFFVDGDGGCISTIVGNLARLAIPREKTIILKMSADRAIKQLAKRGERFDVVFLDPPYRRGTVKQCLINIIRYGILLPKSFVVVEHHKSEIFQEEDSLSLLLKRAYGDTIITIYNHKARVTEPAEDAI